MFRVRRHKSRKTLRLCVTWRLLHHHLPEQIAPGVSVREQGLFQHKTRGLQDAGCWHLVVYGSLFVHSSLITAHSCPPSPLPPAPPPKKPTPQTPSPPPHTHAGGCSSSCLRRVWCTAASRSCPSAQPAPHPCQTLRRGSTTKMWTTQQSW